MAEGRTASALMAGNLPQFTAKAGIFQPIADNKAANNAAKLLFVVVDTKKYIERGPITRNNCPTREIASDGLTLVTDTSHATRL